MIKYILLLWMLWVICPYSSAQDDPQRFLVEASVGYNTFDLHAADKFFQEVIHYYTSRNVAMPTDYELPNNLLWTLKFRVAPFAQSKLLNTTYVGVGFTYTGTKRENVYKDENGEAVLHSHAYLYQPVVTLRYELVKDLYAITPFVELQGTYAFSSAKISEMVDFQELNQFDFKTEIKGKGSSLGGTALIGLAYQLNRWRYSIQGGYHLITMNKIPMKGNTHLNASYPPYFELDYDYSGWQISVSIIKGF